MKPILAGRKVEPPLKGQGDVEYIQPVTKRNGEVVTTTIRVKNTSPAPLDQQLLGLPERFAAWHMGELRRAYRVVYEVKANWKLVMENNRECYHCRSAHPELHSGQDVSVIDPPGQLALRPSHLFYEAEESSFAVGVDAPVHRHSLIPIRIRVKVTPRGVRAKGFHHVIDRFVEVEVIVFVKLDGHCPITLDLSRLIHHFGDPVRISDTIAVEQQKIRGLDDVRCGDPVAVEAGSREIPPAA
jgi:hypothetical protein